MNKPFHPYYVLEDICNDLGLTMKLMGGCSKEHATFTIVADRDVGFKVTTKCVLHGACGESGVILGIGMPARREFNLHDPNSISEITEYIKSDPPWRRASR